MQHLFFPSRHGLKSILPTSLSHKYVSDEKESSTSTAPHPARMNQAPCRIVEFIAMKHRGFGLYAVQLLEEGGHLRLQASFGGREGGEHRNGRLLHLQRHRAHHPHAYPAEAALHHGSQTLCILKARLQLHGGCHYDQVRPYLMRITRRNHIS